MTKQKTNMEILNEIRDMRNENLKGLGDYSVSVVKVEDLGRGKNTGKEIYRLIEEREFIDELTGEFEINPETGKLEKEISQLFYHYDENDGPKLFGVIRNLEYEYDYFEDIIPVGFNGDEEELWNAEREDIEHCLKEREKELKAIAKELGISPEEINSLSEIELSQKIDEMQPEEEKEQEDEPKELSEEEVQKVGMTGMNEIKLNSKVDTKGTDLGQVLKLDGYTKLMVVHSYKLTELSDSEGEQGKVTRNKFSLIAQKEDGTYETIPESKLTPYRGDNREVTEINSKDDIETKNEDCMFEVPGTNKRLVIDQKDPYGIPDVYLSQNTRDNDGQIAQRLQDRYYGTEKQDVEIRALFNQNKGIYQADKSVDEAREHKEAGCDDLDIDEVDGDKNTGHIHFDPETEEQQNAIEEIMERGNVSREEAEFKLMKELETSRDDISLEDAKENAIEEIEQEYRGFDSRKK